MAEVWTPPTLNQIATTNLVTAAYLNQLGNSLRFLKEVAYAEQATDVSVTATTVGTANQIVSSGAVTYEAVPHLIEFYCSKITSGTGGFNMIVRDGTTVLGLILQATASTNVNPGYARFRVTPTAASHTYNIAAWLAAAGTWTVESGSGGAAGTLTESFPISITVKRIPT
jgi:hypothetical protein